MVNIVSAEASFIQRGWKRRFRFFYRLTEKNELEFSEDKKIWEKVKVELVYEDFTLEMTLPGMRMIRMIHPAFFSSCRISCKWFDEVFCIQESHF